MRAKESVVNKLMNKYQPTIEKIIENKQAPIKARAIKAINSLENMYNQVDEDATKNFNNDAFIKRIEQKGYSFKDDKVVYGGTGETALKRRP